MKLDDDGRPVDGAGIPHHVWCNDFTDSWSSPCQFCQSLRDKYPDKAMREDELMQAYFPTVRERN